MGSKSIENACKITNYKKEPWEEIIRKQQIIFYDENNNCSVFTIKVLDTTLPMICLMTKISRILLSHRRILNLCFGKDISDNICKYLPYHKIDYYGNNFYTYKDAFNPYTMKVYKIKNIISNTDCLFELVRHHRYEKSELTLCLHAIT